jgi:heavy metal translocating P-type ATPase
LRTPDGVSPRWVAALALAAIAAGAVLALAGADAAANAIWSTAVAIALVALSASIVRGLQRGHAGVDVIALLAMAGSLILGEALAGAVIALMLAGGNALEEAAGRRARRDLTALLDRAPRVAHRREAGRLVEVPVDALGPGDLVVVRPGEVVPADGGVVEGEAWLDESALTGEALPVLSATARAGTVCAGEAFLLRCERTAADSAYSALVRLVENARASRAPFVRLADRYAVAFLPLTLVIAGAAWVLSDEAIRALAVLVVATPCPLILAAPIAIVSGMSRTARAGVVVKDGGAIERLARARTVVLDKTGTLTLGAPELVDVSASDGVDADELLRLAASVDQVSAHGIAEAVVHAAERRGLQLALPEHVTERPGQGVEGEVDGRRVTVGSAAWLTERGIDATAQGTVLVGVDGHTAGALVLADRLREDAPAAIAALRASGVRRVIMATGDRREVAETVARQAGIDDVRAELEPEDKLALVRDAPERPVIMVGDGVNDAPALALADVGVAMGVAGATASAEAADAVIVVDRLDRLADALQISARAFSIARQSVLAGMGLSLAAMVVAALGGLTPLEGAVLQEGIDVAVILNALRALRG